MAGWNAAFQSARRTSANDFSTYEELGLKLFPPLVAEVWRTDHSHAIDLASVEQLAGNEPGLDGFSYANIVSDEQANQFLTKGHKQRDKLVSARLNRQIAETSKRPRTGAQLQPQGIAHKKARRLRAGFRRVGFWKGGGFGRLWL
jgi:hypothetical protein